MPRYDYKCLECGLIFEIDTRWPDEIKCDKCDNKDLKKMEKQFPTGGDFVLKGRGWFNKGGY